MTIGERIRRLRISMNMTQEELANIVGYKSRSSIQKIETGERDITQSTIALFAKALNVSPGEIMGWDPEFESEKHLSVEEYRKLICKVEEETKDSLYDKYSSLDDHGKRIVEMVLDEEYWRCNCSYGGSRYSDDYAR